MFISVNYLQFKHQVPSLASEVEDIVSLVISDPIQDVIFIPISNLEFSCWVSHLSISEASHVDLFYHFAGLGINFDYVVLHKDVSPYESIDELQLVEVFDRVPVLVSDWNAVFHL